MNKYNTSYRWILFLLAIIIMPAITEASSHREAPLISNDPLADNADLYAFRSPDNPDMITIIATYIPMQLPHGGPNYYTFGENIRYEIHVDNDPNIVGDEVTYRFTFSQVNEDPTTFFNIRLGKQNLKTTYTVERSMNGGMSFETILQNGIVPPNNIGTRSIESSVGLGTTYDALFNGAITQANTGESIFAGPTDDPFFVDLAGIFDLGDAPRQNGTPRDALQCYNVSAIAIQVPIATLRKANAPATPTTILDSDYIIGVWASASRPSMTTLSSDADPTFEGDWVQVSRLGMPLTNEAVIPIGSKDFWNCITPYDEINETTLDQYFYNPELALYMDDDQFGAAVPAFGPLRIQTNSLGAFDFSNGADGLYSLKGSPAVSGTALDDNIFGSLLLPGPGLPRSVDLWPTFHTGVPNFPPYQLATGKEGNPLAVGKPFVNNFLPNGGDMLRLNMAVPATPRDDVNFSSLGLIQAAALGLTAAPYNSSADLEFIPNMDGFPNGRRLEDDVTRIELQAVAGVVLAAVGLWCDDYDPNTSSSPVTEDLLNVLTFTTGVETNDVPFTGGFPYLAQPFSGTGNCSGEVINQDGADLSLSLEADNLLFEQYETTIFTLIVKNDGPATSEEVEVSFPLMQDWKFTDAGTSKGEYNLFFETWYVGTLAAGEEAMLELELFSKTDNGPVIAYAEVINSSEDDPDSTPNNGNGITPNEDDEIALTLTSIEDGGSTGGFGTADLSLNISGPTSAVDLYTSVNLTFTLTNDGPNAATDILVNIPQPEGLKFTSQNALQGDYNLFFEKWNIDELPAGQTATLEISWFTVEESTYTQYAEVFVAGQTDPDSSPGNGNGFSAQEDDEAINIISVLNTSAPQNISYRINGPEINQIFPNPANNDLNLIISSNQTGNYTLEIFSLNGSEQRFESLDLSEGKQQISLDVSELAAGLYYLRVLQTGYVTKFVIAKK